MVTSPFIIAPSGVSVAGCRARLQSEVVFDQQADAVVGHKMQVCVVDYAAVGGYVSVGAGCILVLEPQIERPDVVAYGWRDTVDAVEVGEVFAPFHVDMICRSSRTAEVQQVA